MKELIQTILDRIEIEKKEKLTRLLNKCIKIGIDADKLEHATADQVIFKMETFFRGLPGALNEIPKGERQALTFKIMEIIFEELGLEVDKDECFILYHIRDLGKFRVKETKLFDELTIEWKTHKDYVLDSQDYSYALKNLMRSKLIDYRKRNIALKQTLTFCYKF
ncbi:hypothetical protein A9Q84_00670 [Halobacteriovorax marinus]|uniref:Uncharacterized protein n=1 Tax=Halobacteriovorax marinus TaxID=97084 RepID=A0A1Y5FFP0_9BACT|nr:hypothetical protein A9Q84_00670 [Halobacteriovorax marinus]